MSAAELSAPEGKEGGFVCLVDGDGQYNLSEEQLKELISYVDPKNTRDYSIVGIMGCQSSGKSTLLNRLFNTKFTMMDTSRGRGQTTKGIWLDAARTTQNLVVMDLEGTDSGERGEDRTTFERQTILYALALCEILIVNLWENDIGRYTASNIGVLKTVFEVNMQLFKKTRGKTMLLFIVRDHIEESSAFVNIQGKLATDIENLWNEVAKPEELTDAKLDDFFECKFVPLPHYFYKTEQFMNDTEELRARFADKSRDDCFLNTEYHGQKSVPADGFAHYAQSVWETIKCNKDLNLPSQREMLSTFRCDELSAQAKVQFAEDLEPLKQAAASGFVGDAGNKLGKLAREALEIYDEGAGKYVQSVATVKREELLARLRDTCIEILQSQLSHVVKQNTKLFSSSLRSKFPSDKPAPAFYTLVALARDEALDKFDESTRSLLNGLEPTFTISTQQQKEEFIRHMDSAVQAARIEQLILLADAASEECRQKSANDVADLFQRSDDDMWPALGAVFTRVFDEVRDNIESQLEELKARPNEIRSIERRLISKMEAFFLEGAQQEARGLSGKMLSAFVDIFQKDPASGMPRRWTTSLDVDGLYLKGQSEALRLPPLFAQMHLREKWGSRCDAIMTQPIFPSPPASPTSSSGRRSAAHSRAHSRVASTLEAPAEEDENKDLLVDVADVEVDVTERSEQEEEEDEEEQVTNYAPETDFATAMGRRASVFAPSKAVVELLSKEQLLHLENEFRREASVYLIQARNEQDNARRNAGLPMWVYIALFVLGYNEFVAFAKSPFVMYPVILLGLGCVVLIQMGLWDVTVAAVKLTWQQFQKHLQGPEDTAVAPIPQAPSALGSSGLTAAQRLAAKKYATMPSALTRQHDAGSNAPPEIKLPAPGPHSKDD